MAVFGARNAAKVVVYWKGSFGWPQNGIIPGTSGTYFGYSVDVSDAPLSGGKKAVIVGAPLEDSSAYTSSGARVKVENSGAVYFYEK